MACHKKVISIPTLMFFTFPKKIVTVGVVFISFVIHGDFHIRALILKTLFNTAVTGAILNLFCDTGVMF